MRVLLTEMRRGEAKWAAALMGAVGVYYFTSESPGDSDWIGWWTQTSLQVQLFSVIVMGSVMSSAAAWGAGRAFRHRTRPWADTAARNGWSQALLLWLAAWLWTLLAYVLFVVVAFTRTAAVSDVTEPAWTPLLLGASMTGLQTAFGAAVGSALPSRVIAPFAGIFWYGLFVLVAFVPGTALDKLFPAIDEFWSSEFAPNTTRMLVAVAWCLALGLLLPALPALRRRATLAPRPAALGALALVAVVAGGTLVAFRTPAPDSYWAVRKAQPAHPLCAGSGGTKVCLWPEDRHLLPQARAAARTVDSRLGSLTGLNRSFYASGLDRPAGDTAELPVMSPAESEADLTDAMFAAALPQPASPDCGPHMLPETGGYPDTFLFEAVVRSRAGAPGEYFGEKFGRALGRVTGAPRAVQDAWIGQAAERIRACEPVPRLPR
ncbi:hypothetical protein GT045_25260 [Streptomyces sp. SID486]|uniref:DUF7224 domain-containing protein n=1 Tax=Streptomyces sp. SID486 TaxID=2690264 RepID=UPI00136AB3D3|nr:hypothetical protein [Streptomyces sp. SID486]MYW16265.1 hypothetical protein [Streptomyces sp. SID2955]MYX98030.1 hypothetical protein [Streptomyces sp. SID486]